MSINIFIGYWEPYLARLNNQGKYNAWSTEQNSSWIQVCVESVMSVSLTTFVHKHFLCE